MHGESSPSVHTLGILPVHSSLHFPAAQVWVTAGQTHASEHVSLVAHSGLHVPPSHTGVALGQTQVELQLPPTSHSFCWRGCRGSVWITGVVFCTMYYCQLHLSKGAFAKVRARADFQGKVSLASALDLAGLAQIPHLACSGSWAVAGVGGRGAYAAQAGRVGGAHGLRSQNGGHSLERPCNTECHCTDGPSPAGSFQHPR